MSDTNKLAIKKITIVCGQCGEDYDIDEDGHYVDVIRDVDGWGKQCPHCNGVNSIALKIVGITTESAKNRQARIGTPVKDAVEDAERRLRLTRVG